MPCRERRELEADEASCRPKLLREMQRNDAPATSCCCISVSTRTKSASSSRSHVSLDGVDSLVQVEATHPDAFDVVHDACGGPGGSAVPAVLRPGGSAPARIAAVRATEPIWP